MDPWVLWLIAAVVLAVGEIATMGFFLAPFAGGAAVAALLAAFDAGATIEPAAFLVVSIVLLAALRPLARSHQQRQGGQDGDGGAGRPDGDGRRAHRERRGRRLRQARRRDLDRARL